MTPEERRAYDRAYYRMHREKKKEQQKRYVERLGGAAVVSKKARDKNRAKYNETCRKRYKRINTEEYRAERRRRYAEKHANDPMTEHRRACIEAAKKRMFILLEERRAKRQFEKDYNAECSND